MGRCIKDPTNVGEHNIYRDSTGSLIRTMLVPFPFLVHKSLRVEKSTTHARQGTRYNNAPKGIQEGNTRIKFDSGTSLSQHRNHFLTVKLHKTTVVALLGFKRRAIVLK